MDITKRQDDDSHWYWIPNRLLCEFDNELAKITGIDYMDNPEAFNAFIEKYDKYRTGGSPDLIPTYFNNKTE